MIFEGIALKNGTFVFFDGEEAFRKNITGEFNPSYLRYQEINAQIPKGRMEYDGSLFFDIDHFNALDRSGFFIDDISGPLRIIGSDVILPKLNIKTGETHLMGSFSIKKDPRKKGTYFQKFIYRLNLVDYKITLSDLSTFAPYLKEHSLKLQVNAEMIGPLANFKVNKLIATTANGSRLNLNYRMTGLPNINELFQTVSFKQSFVAQKDIQDMFQNETWASTLVPFGNVMLNLKCEIPTGSYKQTGTMQTQAGNFDGFFEVDYENIDSISPFVCRGLFTQLRSRIWDDSTQKIDKVSARVDIQGDRFDSSLNSTFNIKQVSGFVNGGYVDNISLEGWTRNGDFNAEIGAQNDKIRLGLSLDWSDFYSENREVNVTGKIAKFDLFGLGLDTIRHVISGEVNLNLIGTNIDNYKGSLSVDFARFDRDKTEFQLQHQIITRPETDFLGFKGDWLDGSISGPLKLSNTALWIKQIAHSIAPERFPEVKENLNDSIYI